MGTGAVKGGHHRRAAHAVPKAHPRDHIKAKSPGRHPRKAGRKPSSKPVHKPVPKPASHQPSRYALQHPVKGRSPGVMHHSVRTRFAPRVAALVPTITDRRENDRNIRSEMFEKVTLNGKTLPGILKSRPAFWKTIYRIGQELRVSPVYVAGVVYAETSFGIPNSTPAVKGLGQFTEEAWQQVTTSTAYQDAWRHLMGNSSIPPWGTSPTASLLAIAVRYEMDRKKFGIGQDGDPLVNFRENYLCHMLKISTARAFLAEEPVAGSPGKTEKAYARRERSGRLFNDDGTERNWVKYKNALQLLSQNLPAGLGALQILLAANE